MLSREGKQTDRGAVGAEFIGYNRRRREALLLQEFPHQPNCRPSVPAGLNQEIQDFALTVHGTPEIELPPSNYDDHLVQVPAFCRSWPPTLSPPRIGPTEFQDPSSNCLIRDVETTLGKQVLNVPIAQRETAIEPDGMLDDDRWKAVTTVGYLAHPETLKHLPCRSHAVNVTMPSADLAGDFRLPSYARLKDLFSQLTGKERASLLALAWYAPDLIARADILIRALGRPVMDDPALGLAPAELADCVVRTLSIPEVVAVRPRLKPEFPVYASELGEAHEEATAGVADAIAFDPDGVPEVVIDWKSDVDPSPGTLDHYRDQVRAYLDVTGAERGLVVAVTSGALIPVTPTSTPTAAP